MKDINNWTTKERVGFSSPFKKVGCITVLDLNSKSTVCYVLATLVLDKISFWRRMIQKECSEPDVKKPLLAKTLSIEILLNVY